MVGGKWKSGTWAEGGEEVCCGKRVEDVGWGEPGAAKLADAEADFAEVAGVVGIGVDDEFAAEFFGEAEVAVVEVEPLWGGIVLDGDAELGAAAEDGGQI